MAINALTCSHNILLDDKLNAKLADFGLVSSPPMISMFGSTTVLQTTIYVRKNRGYLSPEHFDITVGPYTDVYSYGVIGLEN